MLGANDLEVPRVELNLDLDSDVRSQWPLARERGEYAIMARALPHIGTDHQVDIRLTQSICANGAGSGASRPREVSEKCWTYNALRNGHPLFFFLAVWKAAPGSNLEDFLRQH